MAGVQKADIPEISEFMSEIWLFMKSFWIPEDSEAYWAAVKDASSKILSKYKNDFCEAETCFVLEYLKWKSKKDNKQTECDFNTWLYMERAEMVRLKIEEELEKKIKLVPREKNPKGGPASEAKQEGC